MKNFSNLPQMIQYFKILLSVFWLNSLCLVAQAKLVTADANGRNLESNFQLNKSQADVGSINGIVWNDLDKNGQRETGELAVKGMKVVLWAFDAIGTSLTDIDSVATDNEGKYHFANLKNGSYLVEFRFNTEITETFEGFTLTENGTEETNSNASKIGYSKTLLITAENPSPSHIDAGLIRKLLKGSIESHVWQDVNKNGFQDTDDLPVKGLKVNLWAFDAVGSSLTHQDSTLTNASGDYSFGELDKGKYLLEFVLDADQFEGFTQNNVGSDEADSDVGLTGFSATIEVDPADVNRRKITNIGAGLISKTNATGIIGEYVWNDANKNGQQDEDELPAASVGVALWLFDEAGTSLTQVDSTITDDTGLYLFKNIKKGKYAVQVILNDEFEGFTTKNSGSAETDSDVNSSGFTSVISIDPAEINQTNIVNIDAGLIAKQFTVGSIADIVWQDTNKNGEHDTNEPGIGGINITLFVFDEMGTSLTQIDSATTNALGEYHFDSLNKGEYVVQFMFNEQQSSRFETVSASSRSSFSTMSARSTEPTQSTVGPTFPVSIDPADSNSRNVTVVSSGLILRLACVDACLPVTVTRGK